MKITFLGDSNTAAITMTEPQRFCTKVGLANGYPSADIINAGVPGDESGNALSRLGPVIADSPDVCVVMLMTNDAKNGKSVASFEANMRSIIEGLQAANIKVVIASPPLQRGGAGGAPHTINRPFVAKLGDLAGEYGCPFVNLYAETAFAYFYLGSTAFADMYSDTIHLSVKGHQFAADYMCRAEFSGVFLPPDI